MTVLTRFGGRPVPSEQGLIYDFPRLREACPLSPARSDGSSSSSSSSSSYSLPPPPPPYLYERPHSFSRAPITQLQLAGALGLINVFGAIWLVDKAKDLEGLVISPLVDTALGGSRLLLVYACLYLLIPLLRMVLIAYVNSSIERRNARRRALVDGYDRQLTDPKSRLSQRILLASQYRMKVTA